MQQSHKYKVGDKIFAPTRYNGYVPRIIEELVYDEEGNPAYALNESVLISKDGDRLGYNEVFEFDAGDPMSGEIWVTGAPISEQLCLQIGDEKPSLLFFGFTKTDSKTLVEEDINFDK